VLLKDTIAVLCGRDDIDPRQVIYLPTDAMRAGDLNRVAKLGRELTRSVGEAPRVWLLDEVTGIAGWTETLKCLRDNTEFGGETVVCTGSSWDENAQIERGNEVDFAPIPAGGPSSPMMTTPIEAKWVTTGWRSEARTVEGKFTRGLVATRTITDLQHPSWAVPAPPVALLLTWRLSQFERVDGRSRG